jgi:hypothetical protein
MNLDPRMRNADPVRQHQTVGLNVVGHQNDVANRIAHEIDPLIGDRPPGWHAGFDQTDARDLERYPRTWSDLRP